MCPLFMNEVFEIAPQRKGYLRYKMIASQNMWSEAQVNIFLFYRTVTRRSQDSLLNCVPWMLKTCLHAHMPTCFAWLHAQVPCVLTCQRALCAQVPMCLACLRTYMSTCFCACILTYHYALRAYMLMCQHALCALVLKCKCALSAYVSHILISFACLCTHVFQRALQAHMLTCQYDLSPLPHMWSCDHLPTCLASPVSSFDATFFCSFTTVVVDCTHCW